MAEQAYFEDINVGDEIPRGSAAPDATQLFFFSSATYNGHRIHFDLPYAKEEEGHPNLLVHGPLQQALMARTLTDWAGPHGRLVKISLQNRANAFPGEKLTFVAKCIGKRQEDGNNLVDFEVHEEKEDGTVIMPGTATVSVPARG